MLPFTIYWKAAKEIKEIHLQWSENMNELKKDLMQKMQSMLKKMMLKLKFRISQDTRNTRTFYFKC